MTKTNENTNQADVYIDITGEICPMTFVKTKLAIEKMASGQLLEVLLRGEEPLSNVPRSVREHGHEVVSLIPEDGEPDTAYRLLIRKT